MTDTVYAVDGGLEDWAYAAGFEENEGCRPSTFVGYALSRTQNYTRNGGSLRTIMYLIESSDQYTPIESSLGTVEQFWPTLETSEKSAEELGHVSRNMRVVLKMSEMLAPGVIFPERPSVRGGTVYVSMMFYGCEQVDSFTIHLSHTCSSSARVGLYTKSTLETSVVYRSSGVTK